MDKDEAAWRILEHVNEWIRFADTKSGASLAGAGLVGAVLAQAAVSEGSSGGSTTAVFLAALAGALAAVSAVVSAFSLMPRLSVGEPVSLIYFDHVARRFSGDAAGHAKKVDEMLDDPSAVLDELSHQIWANSRVARAKYLSGGIALVLLLASILRPPEVAEPQVP
jgi:hypothetical protein